LKTNLEAAEEISRQLRLRDLAGLIVIDFIDMEENRNNRAVEKKLKECLKDDRARIQIGRISAFGLLEMSRQRIRTGVLESSSVPCPHCAGAGMIRSTSSVSLQILRALEEALIKSNAHNLSVRTRPEVALYVLNQKRAHLTDLETRFGVAISITTDSTLLGTRYFEVERGEFVGNEGRVAPVPAIRAEAIAADLDDEALDAAAEAEALDAESGDGEPAAEAQGERGETDRDGGRKRRRRRRRRRGGDRDGQGQFEADQAEGESEEGDGGDDTDAAAEGGSETPAEQAAVAIVTEEPAVEAAAPEIDETPVPAKPKRSRARKPKAEVEAEAAPAKAEVEETVAAEAPAEKPKRSRSRKKVVPITEDGAASAADLPVEAEGQPAPVAAEPEQASPAAEAPAPAGEPETAPARRPAEEPVAVVLTEPDPTRPKRGGWWNRLAGRS
uniref:ribonuclease E/G n=1 Tax=Bosea sp. (in: a-proteobacteria) TaxID=1871050 RepID=UPI003B3B5CDE